MAQAYRVLDVEDKRVSVYPAEQVRDLADLEEVRNDTVPLRDLAVVFFMDSWAF